MEGAEHRKNAKQNSLPLKPVVWDFYHQQEVQAEVSLLGERLPGHQEGWQQEPWLCSATKEWKHEITLLLGARNIREQPKDAKAFKCYAQYPVMQGSQEGKRADLWGLRAQLGVNIPMNIGLEYQCLKGFCKNSNHNKNRTRIQMF